MELTRRRALVAAVLTGLGGCSGLDDQATNSSDGSDNATTDQETDDGAEENESGDGTDEAETDGTDDGNSDEELLIAFADTIDEQGREKIRRAVGRTEEIVGESLADEVTVEYAAPGFRPVNLLFPDAGALHAIGRIAHREGPPENFFGAYGGYVNNEVTFVNPDETDEMRELLRQSSPVEVPADALDAYLDETLVAHEFTHALQYDIVADLELGSAYRGSSYDNRQAGLCVSEGTAEYVAGRYRANCQGGLYDECAVVEFWINALQTPIWATHLRMWYINGMVLAHYLHEDGGWDAVWAHHRNPPETAWVAMFPATYVADGFDYETVSVPTDTIDGWETVVTDRLGVNTLYEKLYRLGQTAPQNEDATVAQEVTDATTLEQMFRSELLRGWRGDQFVAYAHTEDSQRLVSEWVVEMATPAAAEALASAFGQGYEESGTSTDQGWTVGGDLFTVDREGTRLELWMADDAEALGQFRE